jgi:hypothetical protein
VCGIERIRGPGGTINGLEHVPKVLFRFLSVDDRPGGKKMSELIVIGYRDPEEADRVLSKLHRLRREYPADEDAVVVVRDERGLVHIKQGSDLVKAGAKDGLLTGRVYGAHSSVSKQPRQTGDIDE